MKKLLLPLLLLPLLSHAQELKLLSWNVFMMPRPINFSLQGKRTPLIIEELKKVPYDLILLQEAFIGKFRRKLGEAMEESYPHQRYLRRSIRPWHILGSGLFVLSRHPFEVLGHWYYTSCTHADCLAAKGVLLIEVKLPQGKKVQVAMTHTQAWDDEKAQGVRAYQFQEIKNLLEAHATAGVAQILAGDLNIDGRANHEYPILLDTLGMEARPLDGELQYTNGFKVDCYKIPGGTPGQWLDHVWLQPRGSGARLASNSVRVISGILKGRECPLSDHYALEATVEL